MLSAPRRWTRLRRLLAEAPADLEDRVHADAGRELERLGEVLHSAYGVPAGAEVSRGEIIAQINGCAVAGDADLVVLGARGASYMRHLLLGSTAERLVRKSVKPLLVVRQPPDEAYRRVLVAVDFSLSLRRRSSSCCTPTRRRSRTGFARPASATKPSTSTGRSPGVRPCKQ